MPKNEAKFYRHFGILLPFVYIGVCPNVCLPHHLNQKNSFNNKPQARDLWMVWLKQDKLERNETWSQLFWEGMHFGKQIFSFMISFKYHSTMKSCVKFDTFFSFRHRLTIDIMKQLTVSQRYFMIIKQDKKVMNNV